MARYEIIPICRKAVEPVVLLGNAVRDFPLDRNEEYTGEARCDG